MSYKNPILQTNKILYDQDLEVETGYNTLLNGPIVLPNVTVNGILNVISELDVTGNTFISANGVLNVTG